MSALEGLLVDFDGVIARTSVERTIDFVHAYVDAIAPISRRIVHDYVKSILCFPVDRSVDLLFSSLGLSAHIEDFYREFRRLDADPTRIVVEEDFEALTAYCKGRCLAFHIFSLASVERLRLIRGFDPAWVCSLGGRSKADPKTFAWLKSHMRLDPERWIHVDDAPIALRSAKLEGFRTVMMLNSVFTASDYADSREFIDAKVRSFEELQRYLG